MGTMTDEEFAEKVDWEGGLWEALLGYGLHSSQLSNTEGELYLALVQLEAIILTPEFTEAVRAVEHSLPEEY